MNRLALPLLALCALALPAALLAQTQSPPPYVDYQGVVLDSAGNVLAPDAGNGTPQPINYAMEFRLYDASTGGNTVWAEKQNVTVSGGKFSVQLGRGTPINGVTTQVPNIQDAFAGSNRYLGVGVTIPPATGPVEIVPRLQFLSSPFAYTSARSLIAENVSQAAAGTSTFLGTTNMNAATITTGTITNATITGGTLSGNGAGLTTLNAANISSGALADARLSSNVALLNKAETFTSTVNFSGQAGFSADVFLNGQLLRLDTNANAFLRHYPSTTYGGAGVNGPVLAGIDSGLLGTTNGGQKWALFWASNGQVSINNSLFVNNGGAQITAGGLNVVAGGASIGGNTTVNGVLTQNGTANMNGTVNLNNASLHIYNVNDYPFYVAGDTFGQIRYINGYDGSKWYQIGIDASSNFSFNPFAGVGSFINRADGSFHINSDRRLKKDIEPLPQVLDKVLQLRPVSYHFKVNEPGTPRSLGFIAQEVEPLFPEVVSQGANGYKSMAYAELVPVAVAALQEEHRRVEERDRQKDAEIQKLQEQNAALEKRLEAIEAKLKNQ